ncbi:MAG TPA: hypothetical protein VNZ52_05255 [Candidatus Thermoplasmatota archaeon]|nr:hypothetical protein [Candidatus Thermoplasmatota archaeon]
MSVRLFAPCVALLLVLVAGVATAAPTGPQALTCDPDPNPARGQHIESQYLLTFVSLSEIEVSGILGVKKVTLNTGVESADGIRNAYAQQKEGAPGSGDLVQSIEQEVTVAFEQGLRRAFPEGHVSVEPADLDQASLEKPREGTCWGPPVDFHVRGHVLLDFTELAGPEAKEEDAQVAFRIGATLDSYFNVSTPAGHNASYRFVLPSLPPLQVERISSLSEAYGALARSMPLVFVGEPEGVTKVSETEATLTVEAWNAPGPRTVPIKLPLGGRGAPRYTEQDAKVEVTVDLKEIKTSLGDLMDNKKPTIDVDVRANAVIDVMKVPDSFKARLAESNLRLEYVDSDGIRLLIHKKVIAQDRLDRIEKSLLDKLRAKVVDLGGSRDSVKGGFQAGTLDWTGAFANKGLVFQATSSFTIVPGQKSATGAPTEGLSFYTISQSIKPTLVEGYPTDYVVYLPKHIELVSAAYTLGNAETLPVTGDQEGFRVRVTEDGGVVTMGLGVTPSFLWSTFPGLVLGVLAVVLLILLGIFLLVRKIVRRNK